MFTAFSLELPFEVLFKLEAEYRGIRNDRWELSQSRLVAIKPASEKFIRHAIAAIGLFNVTAGIEGNQKPV